MFRNFALKFLAAVAVVAIFVAVGAIIQLLTPPKLWSELTAEEQELRFAKAQKSVEDLHWALETGMPIDHEILGRAGLMCALALGDEDPEHFAEMMGAVLARGGDLQEEAIGKTPLGIVLSTDRSGNSRPDWKRKAEILVELGADVNSPSHLGMAPLTALTLWNTPNHHKPDKISPLFDPLWQEKLEWLVENGASLDGSDGNAGKSILWDAIGARKSQEVIATLIALGADVFSLDRDTNALGAIILSYSFWANCDQCNHCNQTHEIVQLLLDHGADVNRGSESNRPLAAAAKHAKDPQIITVLLEAGADPRIMVTEKRRKTSGNRERYTVQRTLIDVARDNEALKGTPELETLAKAALSLAEAR